MLLPASHDGRPGLLSPRLPDCLEGQAVGDVGMEMLRRMDGLRAATAAATATATAGGRRVRVGEQAVEGVLGEHLGGQNWGRVQPAGVVWEQDDDGTCLEQVGDFLKARDGLLVEPRLCGVVAVREHGGCHAGDAIRYQ